ncbi:TetR/AcrR family transcriptional regulator [Desulfatitalea tepidiphila]|uniref:TetR/AcrR family transcriptional regulator n=1 Tax=Desulfatitalea tepidiphila TaxID=1185843 RepID=UPI0006B656A4|nr:TetR/AcrR family transcriptional regulator [Desulfatitalea tepidiphila]
MGIQDRREREKEQRRNQIIVAARRVFHEKGFTNATIKNIANEAELGFGTLYLYFKNKEELFVALSLRVFHYLNMRISHIIKQGNLSKMQQLDALKNVLIDVYNYDPVVTINMYHLQSSQTLKNLPEDLLDEITNLARYSTIAIAKIFEEGVDAGLFIKKNPFALADIFGALFSGIVLWETSKNILDDKKNHLKSTLGTAYEIFSRGILAQPS